MAQQRVFVIDEDGAREQIIDLAKTETKTVDYLRDVMQISRTTPLNFFQLPEVPELNNHVLVGPTYLGHIYPFALAVEFLSFRVETPRGFERALIHGPLLVGETPFMGNILGHDPKITVEELNALFTPLNRLLSQLENEDAVISESGSSRPSGPPHYGSFR